MLQEDNEKVQRLRLEFIKKGLENKENCLYVTTQRDKGRFEVELSKMGIDVKKFQKSGALKIISISDPFVQEEGFTASISAVWKTLPIDNTKKTRIACNVLKDITKITNDQVKEIIKVEAWLQEKFMSSNFTILCTCDISNIDSSTEPTFLKNIQNHHGVMFAPKESAGLGFYLN